MPNTLYSVVLLLLLASCSQESNSSSLTTPLFNPSAPPLTVGEWYKPDVTTSWQWQLKNSLNTTYDVEIYDIDLFDTNASLISTLKDNGKKVICYFSAGSYENWREDKESFDKELLGKTLDGWEDEQWLDISNEKLAPIMRARLDLALSKGCDGVEPDNMDAYQNESGFILSSDEQLGYNKFIANEARKRGLSVALKNDLSQVIELEPYFDFSINEECNIYNECDVLQTFINANKPVLNAEYDASYVKSNNNQRDSLCQSAKSSHFQTLILPLELDDSFRYTCD